MARRKLPFHRPFTNDFSAEEKRSPRIGFRLDNERFCVLERFHSSIHATQDSVAKTPLFLERSLSGSDNGRVRAIRAQFWLRELGGKRDRPSESSGQVNVPSQIRDQGCLWATSGIGSVFRVAPSFFRNGSRNHRRFSFAERVAYWTTTWSMSKYLFTSKRVLSIVRPFFPIAIALSWGSTSTTTIFLSGLSVTRISLILAGERLFRIRPSGVSAYSTTSI